MEVNEIIKLINAVSEADVVNFNMKQNDFYLTIDKKIDESSNLSTCATFSIDSSQKQLEEKTETLNKEKKEEKDNTPPSTMSLTSSLDCKFQEQSEDKKESTEEFVVIKSPMVGTFYSAAGPDQEDYVKVGDSISKKSTLCIIEAMKLMNTIESDYDGVIVEVLTENESMVEYDQPLFKIKLC